MEGFRSKEEMPKGGHAKARQEAQDKGDHISNLFDQEEDMYGNRMDPVTGQPINATPETDGADEELTVIEEGKESNNMTEDVLGDVSSEEDEAERWLREHDPNYQAKK